MVACDAYLMDDATFQADFAERLDRLPSVEAVMLGGSRALGLHGADSDWDFAIYYRGVFEPQDLRNCGWEGVVSEIGGWGGGVMNGGAWLNVDGRRVTSTIGTSTRSITGVPRPWRVGSRRSC